MLDNGLEGDRSERADQRRGSACRQDRRAAKRTTACTACSVRSTRRARWRPHAHVEHNDDEPFFDDAPVSLHRRVAGSTGVSSFVGYRVEWERFRPNFYIEALDGIAIDEAALTGRELQLGEVTLRVRYPIERCVVPTYDLHGGEADPRILRYVAQARSNWMGIYCDVPRAGIARIGDSLELIER